MSVGYSMEYSAIIHGSRADFEQIPAIAQKVSDDYAARERSQWAWDQTDFYQSMARYFASSAQEALDSGEDPLTFQVETSDTDDTHGIMEAFLTALDTQLPDLAIAASAIYVDTEYGEGSFGNLLYSPPGSSALDLNNFYGLDGRKDVLPDEDWIPYGWRHPEVAPPAAKATGKLTFLGPWGEQERAAVEQALLGGGVLEAVSIFQPSLETSAPPFVKEEDGVAFSLTGPLNFGDAAQNLELVLSPYLEQHKETYAALCKAMREKQLSLHLLLDEYTGPNAAWTYSDHSKWDLILSSDGERLVSNFARCATYSFGRERSLGQAEAIYKTVCGAELDDLPEEEQFAAKLAIAEFLSRNPIPESDQDLDEEELDEEKFREWFFDHWWDEDEWGSFEDSIVNIVGDGWEDIPFMDLLDQCPFRYDAIEEYRSTHGTIQCVEDNRDALRSAIQKAVAAARRPAHERYIPTDFDQRFKGKRFVVKGKLDGYEEGQAAELVEKFGGKVMKNVTASVSYFVCGRGVGDPIRTAMKHGTTILTADYFEDMTR